MDDDRKLKIKTKHENTACVSFCLFQPKKMMERRLIDLLVG